ncbi:MAG: class B sortase [Eubacterium sp.]|nr:class B sortase [Eubacterium sp.]
MKAFNSIHKVLMTLFYILTSLLAFILICYSGYVIYDNLYKGEKAFSSRDLNQYRPTLTEEHKYSFKEILKINDDVVGWLHIENTHIDYPVTQGKNDTEYANKDVFKRNSLTGSIYLSAQNDENFKDKYNIIYGHHVDNGSMFGDLSKYIDKKYFNSHRNGFLQTPTKNYKIKIFAVAEVDAYDDVVYSIYERNRGSFTDWLNYVERNSKHYSREKKARIEKFIVFSTCKTTSTLGRTVVFADAYETDEIPQYVKDAEKNIAKGHKEIDHWAFLNLVCVLMTIFTLLPMTQTRKKYHQHKYANEIIDNVPDDESVDDLKRFKRKFKAGIIAEIVMIIIAIVAFLLTENIFKPMVIIDEWTWLMILIFAVALALDFILFRYRGKTPPEID